MCLKSSLFRKSLQSVLTVSDKEWRRDLRLSVSSVLSGRNLCKTWWGLCSMFVKRLSSMPAASWDGVGSSAVYKPSRIARRTDASRRCLSVALVKPHRAGDAYNSLGGRRPCRRASTSRRSCRGNAALSGRAVTARTWPPSWLWRIRLRSRSSHSASSSLKAAIGWAGRNCSACCDGERRRVAWVCRCVGHPASRRRRGAWCPTQWRTHATPSRRVHVSLELPETLLVVRRQTPVVPQYSQSIQRLRTLADDTANVVLSELFRVMSGSGGGWWWSLRTSCASQLMNCGADISAWCAAATVDWKYRTRKCGTEFNVWILQRVLITYYINGLSFTKSCIFPIHCFTLILHYPVLYFLRPYLGILAVIAVAAIEIASVIVAYYYRSHYALHRMSSFTCPPLCPQPSCP